MSEQKRDNTVGELFDLLIGIERAAQTFYLRLTEMFAHEPRAAEVWWMMAADEGSHVQLLQRARDTLTPEQLAAPADPHLMEAARTAASLMAKKDWAGIETLEDAYQMAHEGEHSEINSVFEAVISEYFPVSVQQQFVQSQLREHLERLASLEPLDWRLSVRPRRAGSDG
jgi:rubrerythrin